VTERGGMFDFIRTRGEEFFTQVSNELLSNPRFISAMQTAMRGREWMDQAVAQALRTMNVPTRTEFKRALARIDALERELADVKRQTAAAASPRTSARAGGTARRKTAARKRKAPRSAVVAKRAAARVARRRPRGVSGGAANARLVDA